MRRSESREVDRLDFLEPASRMKNTQSISRHQAPKRISNHAEFGYVMSIALQFLQFLLDFLCAPLGANFDSIVCEVARVALGDENDELVFAVLLAQCRGDVFEMVRCPPKPSKRSALHGNRQENVSLTYPCTRTQRWSAFELIFAVQRSTLALLAIFLERIERNSSASSKGVAVSFDLRRSNDRDTLTYVITLFPIRNQRSLKT